MTKLKKNQLNIYTHYAEQHYEDMVRNVNNYELDEKSTTRLLRRECKTCFYLKGDRIVTQAFADYECKNCESKHTYHNGGVPKYCKDCSNEYGICVRCGSEL